MIFKMKQVFIRDCFNMELRSQSHKKEVRQAVCYSQKVLLSSIFCKLSEACKLFEADIGNALYYIYSLQSECSIISG
jgi:DNA-directed RNA polymerase specialized sigma54-like protein